METGLAFGECGRVDMVMHVDFRHVGDGGTDVSLGEEWVFYQRLPTRCIAITWDTVLSILKRKTTLGPYINPFGRSRPIGSASATSCLLPYLPHCATW
jgi:hypothetical protein